MLAAVLLALASASLVTAAPAGDVVVSRDLWHDENWLGCIKPSSAFSQQGSASILMTPETCSTTCGDKNYNFAMLSSSLLGGVCSCAQDFNSGDSVSALLYCTTPCPGNPLESCGNALGSYDVYLTPVITID
ncbi:uncharacterized protein EHS24_003347 [Apiotrichum porosum]|uniref:WSC domain-containing protein n=1 Tax=Apiotrichum porosum TaxID=105984 RepID=A0A427XEX9_9TREE|nr:uncharacterized protein EHS24_003347 [Apiotrichum porosum]RSH77386.1 hypothetical protein EHS24_003347 [Apiotrichum porosum]